MANEFILPFDKHDEIVTASYIRRGFSEEEASCATKLCRDALAHGIKTHNALKALHLVDVFPEGCKPNATIEKLPSKYKAVQKWNANMKIGQAVAYEAMDEACRMADEYGVGMVAVDNAFHYLWGGGYVIDAAKKGYLAYTGCTSTLAEVVPFCGKFPTLGTNPHSWGFPTQDAVGFPVCIDFATSVTAMGRVQQFAREGKLLPDGSAVDSEGNPTNDPTKVNALLPFGGHKGYGMGLLDELYAAYTGGGIPTIRGRFKNTETSGKKTSAFIFQAIRPDAISCNFEDDRSVSDNVKAILDDVLGHGNRDTGAILPGEIEARAYAQCMKHGGLLVSAAEADEFKALAQEAGIELHLEKL